MPAPIEWRADAGGQLDSDSHGAVSYGVRAGPWSAELLTDTLLLAWAPSGDGGRAWVAARAEFGAAGLMISPWTDGAPDPERASAAFYAGPELGAVRYLPGGLYVGVGTSVRAWWFGTDRYVPRTVASGDAELGLARGPVHAWIDGGVDGSALAIAPHARLVATWHPTWIVAPVVEVRAGVAEGQDDVTRTRLGGLNPYVVPVAGAAWGEWWVEDYAAGRLGVDGGPAWLRFGVFADAAAYDDGGHAEGFGARAGWRRDRWSADLVVGYAPWIARQAELSRISVWVGVARSWGPFR